MQLIAVIMVKERAMQNGMNGMKGKSYCIEINYVGIIHVEILFLSEFFIYIVVEAKI